MEPPILSVDSLDKSFFLHEQGERIPSCSGVSFELRRGELVAIVGTTGAGKSSVLKCIYRTYLSKGGRILYRTASGEQIDLVSAPERRLLELRRDEIAFVTQFLHCLPRRGALDVVCEPLIARGERREAAREQAAELLRLLDIPERLWHVPPATFSGGERQRINLARGLVARPRLLLLDEPTASLDPATTAKVVALIARIKSEGVGMLAIFHSRDLVAQLADRVVELKPPLIHSQETKTP